MKYGLICAILMIAGCALSIDGERYQNQTPKLRAEQFFDGHVKAWGIVQNRSGEVVQQFSVDITGSVEGNELTFDETFTYLIGDGVKERTWTVKILGDGQYRGSASDIPGPAQGKAFGNALRWKYDMTLPVEDKQYDVTFEDWMWAFDDQRLINRSYIKKFGFVVAEVTIYMEKM